MIAAYWDAGAAEGHLVIRPNNSLSWQSTKGVFAGISILALTIAMLFTMVGAWLVLPFVGIELLALGVCLYLSARNNANCEVVSIHADTVTIERGRGQPQQTFKFNRAWARVDLKTSPVRGYPSSLSLVSHGRGVEIGTCLCEEERRQLASDLKKYLSSRRDSKSEDCS